MPGPHPIVDAAVIGGGIVGASAALHLAIRRASVVLFEAKTCGTQASGLNYGGVRQHGRAPAELPLSRRARAMWGGLRDLIGTDGEFVVSGHLRLARDAEEMDALERWHQVARGHGLKPDLLGANVLRARYPWLGRRLAGASWLAEDGQADPSVVSPAFARAAERAGVTVHEHAAVTAAARDGDLFRVETAAGISVRARVLINAAGPAGAEVAAWFGEQVSETVHAPNMNATAPLPPLIGPNLGTARGDIYARQNPKGEVIFGGGRGAYDPATRQSRPSLESAAEACRKLAEIVPQLADVPVARSWTGNEGYMPDGLPVLGPSRTTPGLVHGFGFSGHGFQLGPAAGAVLAELALDGRTDTQVTALGIGRFAQP